MRAWLRSYAW
ncbi:unnamed protein product, partial [Didymodactylos carnosus]